MKLTSKPQEQKDSTVWNSYESYSNENNSSEVSTKKVRKVDDRKTLLPSEFDSAVQDLIDRGVNLNLKRNSFLKLMGASLAMVTANCYKKPLEKIIPYVSKPIDYQPGISSYYATAYITSEGVTPIVVKTIEGKPVKIEGNALHPISKGAIHADAIASIWDLYDPDRLKQSLKKQGNTFKKVATADIIKDIKPLLNGNVAILSKLTYSPSEKSIIEDFTTKYNAKHYVYDSVGNQQEVLHGEEKAFGKAIIPRFAFDKADLILSLEADFLGTWLSPELYTKQFSSRRTPDANMNQLVVAETMMSLTGANADQRFAIRAGTVHIFGLGLAHLIYTASNYSSNPILKETLSLYPPKKVAEICGISEEHLSQLAKKLLSFSGRSLVVGGGPSARVGQDGLVYYIAALLNTLLNNDGITVLTEAVHRSSKGIGVTSSSDFIEFVKSMKRGEVDTLVINRANPVFDLPTSIGFEEGLRKVKNVILLDTHATETSVFAKYVVAVSHAFESWIDGYSNGVYTIAQPLINPLFDTISVGDALVSLVKNTNSTFYNVIQSIGSQYLDTQTWEQTLADGYCINKKILDTTDPRKGFDFAFLTTLEVPTVKRTSDFYLTIYETLAIKDGTGANIAFRQELPDPITKVTWGNFVAVSPLDAESNKWTMGDVLKIVSRTGVLFLPVFIQPGLPKGSLAIAMGYGHSKLGVVAKNVGKNINVFTSLKNSGYQYTGIAVDVFNENRKEKIATTQKHHEIPGVDKRGIIAATTLAEYKKNSKSGHVEAHEAAPGSKLLPGKGLYPEMKYETYKWGMSIDLTKCTGCSACVVACYSENNIPVVGKSEVARGREMSWLRIDRYYGGNAQSPEVFFQPVMCQHCDNAPCENVCPVVATSHSSEGLNDMTYNRCIGTRYCSNNCPYKVRRFNWFENWEGKIRDPEQYALNPEVTVRSRGVIEKCSFCVHRISEKRQLSKLENRTIQDNEVQTACQQACPSNAIVFGNTLDKNATVSQLQDADRSYRIFLNLNVKPSVSYMTKVKNT